MNEKTSERVASQAGWLLNAGKKAVTAIINDLEMSGDKNAADQLRTYSRKAESVAGSALTQKEKP